MVPPCPAAGSQSNALGSEEVLRCPPSSICFPMIPEKLRSMVQPHSSPGMPFAGETKVTSARRQQPHI